jgi:tetratricopeptide (TPR) repeat protein
VAARQFGVNGYPTILFVNEDGFVEDRVVGFLSAKDMGDKLTSVAQAHRDWLLLLDKARADPPDLEAMTKVAATYASRADAANAAAFLAKAEAVDPKNSKDLITRAYNALGDLYQTLGQSNARNFGTAIELFHKAANTSKNPKDRAYGYLSAASCNIQRHRAGEAIPDLNAVINMGGVSNEDRQAAQKLLKRATAVTQSGT